MLEVRSPERVAGLGPGAQEREGKRPSPSKPLLNYRGGEKKKPNRVFEDRAPSVFSFKEVKENGHTTRP